MKSIWKTIFHISIASILSMLVYSICSLPLVAALNDSNNSDVVKLICAILANVAASLFMIWTFYIRTGEESKVVREDYQEQEYRFLDDIKKCLAREQKNLLCILGILTVAFLAFILDDFLLRKEIFSVIAVLYWPLYPFFMVLSETHAWLSPLIGMLQTPITYLLILLLFRKKWYQKWK